MKVGLSPPCAKACPTKSINFGTIVRSQEAGTGPVGQLQQAGESRAYLYGDDENSSRAQLLPICWWTSRKV